MELHEYARYDAIGIRDLVASGEVRAPEVESAARQALEAANRAVNGLALPLFSPALECADDGPFTGVPFLIKDSGPMAEGVPFSCGSRSIPGVPSPYDHDLMTSFRAAGLVTLGLTTTPEMGLSFSNEPVKHGPTRNPWQLDRGVGGSSGGAAALVAVGAVAMAHGNDGAGSLRIPASCCGLVGLKPSRGRTPSGPALGEGPFGTNCEFALTRTVRDAAHLLDAVASAGSGAGARFAAPAPRRRYADELGERPGRLRVAVTTQAWSGAAVDGEVADSARRVGHALEQLAHVVVEASPAVDWPAVMQTMTVNATCCAAPFLFAPRPPELDQMEAVSRAVIRDALSLPALDLLAAFDAQNRVSRSVGAFFTDYDLLVTPTIGQLPAPHGALRYDDPDHTVDSWLRTLFEYGPFTAVFNLSGEPAVSLPLGQSSSGLPIGVQIVAPYGREDLLFRVAAQLEEAMPWRARTPSTFVGAR